MASNTISHAANNSCNHCKGSGGFYDCGWWYECPHCNVTSIPSKTIWPGLEYALKPSTKESVKHPTHYNKHPSGIECIDVVQHMGFNLGNAVKYIWRADLKNDAIEDMKKAIQYLEFEIEKRTKCKS